MVKRRSPSALSHSLHKNYSSPSHTIVLVPHSFCNYFPSIHTVSITHCISKQSSIVKYCYLLFTINIVFCLLWPESNLYQYKIIIYVTYERSWAPPQRWIEMLRNYKISRDWWLEFAPSGRTRCRWMNGLMHSRHSHLWVERKGVSLFSESKDGMAHVGAEVGAEKWKQKEFL